MIGRMIFIAILLSLFSFTTKTAQAKDYALVIGIDVYDHARQWHELDYADDDAKGMKEYLEKQKFKVKYLPGSQATKEVIISWMEDHLAPRLTDQDRFLFFFSGHGETKPIGGSNHGYIIPYMGDNRSSTWISMEKMLEMSNKLGLARHQLFIFDCCFGGLFAMKGSLSSIEPDYPYYIRDVGSRKSRQYLTAAGPDQKARAFGAKGKFSYFTGYLLEALKQGKGDTYPDGHITTSELAAYLTQAAANLDHTPRGGTIPGHEQGEFLFISPVKSRVIAPEDSNKKPIFKSTPDSFINPTRQDQATGMKFVRVKGGCFSMGSPSGEKDRFPNEGPVHEVCVDGFYMAEYETTQGQWKKVMGNNPSQFNKGDNYPVEKVSWNDVQDYIRKLNQQTGKQYRLPTEAEWEYAVRAGTKTRFYFGETISKGQVNYGGGSTVPVGS
ncbi:MAG: SUMF1/EgtB/PvdO family nonheme iron enzyme, partial [Desulfobulbaceae bacterium]|nr:SUMF1/EgtB/PvdO family nonheme iron enzyme [Desulfobulbaceae bacterium]